MTIGAFQVRTMCGPLSSGAERGRGKRKHAVPVLDGRPDSRAKAVCGRAPAIMWGDHEPQSAVSCPACLRRLRAGEKTSESKKPDALTPGHQ